MDTFVFPSLYGSGVALTSCGLDLKLVVCILTLHIKTYVWV